jgi:hypothetical protein
MTGKVAHMSNYPNGFNGGLTVRGLPLNLTHPGKVFWVSDSGLAGFPNRKGPSDGNKGGYLDPFATIDYAIGQCIANRGDVIMVMPGHTDTLTGAAGIALDVAGVNIIGLGQYDDRPRIVLDAAAATVVVSAANCTLKNLTLVAGFADVVAAIDVTAAGVVLDSLVFEDNTTAENFLTPVKSTSTVDNTADGLTVVNCRWSSVDVAGLEFIEANADIKDLVVDGNYVVHEGTASPLVLFATGKDAQYAQITYNFLSHKMTANELLVNIDTAANSGIIAHNRVGHADVTTTHDLGIDALGCRLFDNLSASTDAVSGVVLPAIDVDA